MPQTPRKAGDPSNNPAAPSPQAPLHSAPAMNRAALDRRSGADRRLLADALGDSMTGLERRRGPGRRLSDFSRSAEEGEFTAEQFLFVAAIDAFKKANGVQFPTWTDVLEVVRLLGYRKTMPSELALRNAEDWRERADAPASVRPDNWEKRFAA